MNNGGGNTLIEHLEALWRALLRILAVTLLLFPLAYWASPMAPRMRSVASSFFSAWRRSSTL